MRGIYMEKQQIEPFKNNRVDLPRRIETSVSGLNNKILDELVRQVEKLEKESLPRNERVAHAQLVISSNEGYGKSHLIGRLFYKLSRRATLIYLRPFEDASTCWKSVLHKIVQELKFPDNIEIEYTDDKEPTQLEALAHGILVYLLKDGVETGAIRTKNKESVLNFLSVSTVGKFRKNKKWIKWVRDNYDGLVKQFQKYDINLNASPFSWLKVLFTYAYFPSELRLRESCTDWLEGGSIDSDDAKQIGIRLKDVPNAEMGSGEINELCKYRIIDFCQLAGFFRPFVFCFDQTDRYGNEIILSKAFGAVIETLVAETYNQMTVVTANQEEWDKKITGFWEKSYHARISLPLDIEGLNRKQAEELIEKRLRIWDFESDIILKFYDDKKWLDDLFQDTKDIRIRGFLNRCHNRWLVLFNGKPPVLKIAECYKKAVEEIKTQPKRFVFERDSLYWLIYEVASGLPDFKVEKYESQKGYFVLLWKLKDQQIYFGFENGSHFKRWEAMMREAKICYETDNKNKTVLFRTPELSKIPGIKWKIAPKIEVAKKQYFHIICLDKAEIAKLYAAYDLYIDAGEGNIPFHRYEILTFIRNELKEFWDRILKPLPQEDDNGSENDEVTKKLIKEIRIIVQREKFLSVGQAIKMLSPPVSEELFHEARGHIPEIKIHISPTMTILQWQSKQ